MIAVTFTDSERAQIEQELQLAQDARTRYRAAIHRLRAAGHLTVSYENKLQSQVEAESRHIRRFRSMLDGPTS